MDGQLRSKKERESVNASMNAARRRLRHSSRFIISMINSRDVDVNNLGISYIICVSVFTRCHFATIRN